MVRVLLHLLEHAVAPGKQAMQVPFNVGGNDFPVGIWWT